MRDREREAAGKSWQETNLVFCHENGSMYSSRALNWRFSRMTRKAGIGHWHAHEGRHTAVSNGVPIQEISDTVGHKSTHVTETVYRHVIVPTIRGGATVMDSVFGPEDDESAQPESGSWLGADYRTGPRKICGAKGIRTPDLLHAIYGRNRNYQRLASPASNFAFACVR
jgi:hypothetical protein